jgi:hypothetical protein
VQPLTTNINLQILKQSIRSYQQKLKAMDTFNNVVPSTPSSSRIKSAENPPGAPVKKQRPAPQAYRQTLTTVKAKLF